MKLVDNKNKNFVFIDNITMKMNIDLISKRNTFMKWITKSEDVIRKFALKLSAFFNVGNYNSFGNYSAGITIALIY